MASKQKLNCIYCGKAYSKSGIRMHQFACASKQKSKQKIDLLNHDRQANVEANEKKQTTSKQLNDDLVNQERQANMEANSKQTASKQQGNVYENDPEYDLIKLPKNIAMEKFGKEDIWECQNCDACLDAIEKRCPNCGVRFE